jgi:hypothetical protein
MRSGTKIPPVAALALIVQKTARTLPICSIKGQRTPATYICALHSDRRPAPEGELVGWL